MYRKNLKKQTVEELYRRLQTHIWTANWYINGTVKKVGECGHIYDTAEYVLSHSIEKGVQCLRTVNMILDELRVRGEIE